MKVCSEPGCPVLLPAAGYCPACARRREAQRGTRQARGYDAAHERERRRWARIIARRPVACARCGLPIARGAAFDLGHTEDRTGWTGPEHPACNRGARSTSVVAG